MLLEKTHCERTVVQHEFSVKQRRMNYPVFTNAKQAYNNVRKNSYGIGSGNYGNVISICCWEFCLLSCQVWVILFILEMTTS